jgi:signal transduction histidine kinase
MSEIHSLLKRQIQKSFGDHPPATAEWQAFLKSVDGAYKESDNDRGLLERCLDLSSQEHINATGQMLKIREIALGIESRVNLNEVLGFVVESAREIPGIRFVLVQKPDESQENLVTIYYSKLRKVPAVKLIEGVGFNIRRYLGNSSTSQKLKFPIDKLPLARDFISNPRTMVFDNLAAMLQGVWPRAMCDSIQRIMGVKKVVITPLVVEGKSWGNLAFFLDRHVPLDAMDMITAHCSLGIRNVLMLDFLKIRNQELAVASKLAREVSNSLKSQTKMVERILSTTPNAVLVVNKNLKIILANRAFYSAFKRKKVETKSVAEVIPEFDWPEVILKAFAGKRSVISFELKQKLSDKERIFSANIMKMGQDEVLLLINDITEERQEQEKMYLTDRLASVGEMAAGVAHELNNPLTTVIGLSQLLLEEDMNKNVKEDLEAICSEGQRAAGIVKNLLTFARKHAQNRLPVQINDIVRDVLALRAYEHKVNDIHVVTRLDARLPEIIVDRFQIHQAFLNIVLNAEQAMALSHNKGNLSVITTKYQGNIRISFSDDGPGIPGENMHKLFSPFFTTKEVGKGTGLGLSICYGIITNHGGRISAESEPGNGATFIVELPIIRHLEE